MLFCWKSVWHFVYLDIGSSSTFNPIRRYIYRPRSAPMPRRKGDFPVESLPQVPMWVWVRTPAHQLTVQIVWLSSDMSNPLSISQFKELRNNYLQKKKKQDEKAARVRYVTIGWTDGQLSSKRNTQNLPYPLISKQRSRGAWFGDFRGMTPSGT